MSKLDDAGESGDPPRLRPPRIPPCPDLEGLPPAPDQSAAERVQRSCARLATRLRWGIRELRRALQELEPDLPAPYLRERLLATNHESYPFSVWSASDGLIGEDLCGAVVQLERVASMSADNPEGTLCDPLALWRELDPEAPRELGEEVGE